ncbi:MAG: acetyl-CoA carboxylase biotin carboxyl carrier protein [Simkaniaceae bacterium]|nr:acetyl-CoA carboxylase biotin carboxyl carrier protein [Simkaniaceae bacterium]
MDMQLIKDLIKIMDKGKLAKLHVKEKNGFEISLEKAGQAASGKAHFHQAPVHEFLPVAETAKEMPAKKEVQQSGHFITSPMVGTYYSSPSPDDPVFIKVGDQIEKGSIVCIVEAMKVMNEVKADRSGVIKEILIENSQPVEFGTKLFRIE